MGNKPKCYVAGPLNAPDAVGYIKNMSKMIKIALELHKMGFAVFVPCMDILMGIVHGDFEYYDYAGNNFEFVEVCDCLYKIAPSPGTDKEVEQARKKDIPILTGIVMAQAFMTMWEMEHAD